MEGRSLPSAHNEPEHPSTAQPRRLASQFWKPNMSEQEAKTFVVKALSHAMARDASSGGCIRTVTIDENGARRDFLPGSDVSSGWGGGAIIFPPPSSMRLLLLQVPQCYGEIQRPRVAA